MEKIKKEPQETQAPIDQTGIPSLQTLGNVEQGVAQALEAYRDEPCYPVYYEKEVTKRTAGIDTSWIKCNPLKISVVWDVEESGGSKNENRAKYTLEESYPGYMRIEYDPEERDKINGFHIKGPSPSRLDRVNSSLSKISATFHLYVPPNDVEEIVNTNDPSDFTIHKGTESPDAGISISNDLPGGGCDVSIDSSNIIPSEKFALARGEILSKLEGSTVRVSEGDISAEEIQSGLRERKLVKQFAIRELIDLKGAGNMGVVFKQEGTATVRISFAPVTERWQVIVNTINAMGYGSDDRTFGIQVHTERTVDIVIENDEFKSAEGKTSFVSIRSFSTPPDLFRCQGESIEVAGTGKDAEADHYDQVRNAKRFNPPTNPGDEALKQEYSKIEMHKTPYAFPETYSVKGNKSGAKVDLFFPKESGYVVAHRCDPGDAFIREWQQKWRKQWKTHERWSLRDYDRFLYPETVKIMLEDNWYTEYSYTTSYNGPNVGWKECPAGTPGGRSENTDQIRVKRIE